MEMTGAELGDLFAVFAPEDWDAFSTRLVELSLRYRGLQCRAAFELYWMEIEELVRELASQRLGRQGAELIELTFAS
jgi:hypothetical protein